MKAFAFQTVKSIISYAKICKMPETFVDMTRTDKDELLLSLLSENARAPVSELARRLGLSRTTVQARIERLERDGVIAGYTVRLSTAAERALVRAHVMITVRPRHAVPTIAGLKEIREVRTLHSISGEVDMIAVVAAGSVAALDAVVDRIGALEGVERTQTSVIMATKFDR